ncbi:5-(carboxyamino)imidazole ribonucleotide mutase [Candidatus Saccharibacteria bacterium]|nr:5-(carboxyamino)imidazole ribonucleotide mutase [Candidatus Saccharibacteria bacterium]
MTENTQPIVGIIIGSDSDLDIMKNAAATLDELGITNEIEVVSAHRTPEKMADYASSAQERGLKTIIAGAGGSAHLPGMTAAYTELPVIAVPIVRDNNDAAIKSNNAMPPGVPLAVMPTNGSINAALFAAAIIAVENAEVRDRLKTYRQNMHDKVIDTAEKLKDIGWENYFDQ